MRATSNRLCFMASMARSNNTLSGCLEPTSAKGLLTFLFVQALARARTPSRSRIGKRRIMRTSGEAVMRRQHDCKQGAERKHLLVLYLQQRGLGGDFQQGLGVNL